MPLPQAVIECNSVQFVKAAIQTTDCIALVSKMSVNLDENNGVIRTVELNSEFMTRQIGMTWRADRGLSAAAERLMGIVEKNHGRRH